MAFAIAVSLLVSFTLTPMLSARWLKPAPVRHDGEAKAGQEALLERVVDCLLPADRARLHARARAG